MYYLILLNKGLKEKTNHMFNKLELLHRETRKIQTFSQFLCIESIDANT